MWAVVAQLNKYLHICCVLQLLNQLHSGVQVNSYRVHGLFLFRRDLLHLCAQGRMPRFDRRQVLQQLNRISLNEIHNHRFRNTDSVFNIKKMNTNIPQMCPLLLHRPQSQISAAFPHILYQLLLSGTTRTQI